MRIMIKFNYGKIENHQEKTYFENTHSGSTMYRILITTSFARMIKIIQYNGYLISINFEHPTVCSIPALQEHFNKDYFANESQYISLINDIDDLIG